MPLFATNKSFFLHSAWKRSFFVTLFFVTLASCLFWLDTFRGYEAEVRVLIIGKSPSTSTDQIVENFAELTSNLSFYERFLLRNDLLEDDFMGYSQDRRKTLWNEAVTARRSDKSGVLIITARQNTNEKARLFAEETVKTLFSVAPFYYNIQTDVDLRIVDGTIVRTTLRNPFQYWVTSFVSAFFSTILFFTLLTVMPFFFRERKGQALAPRMMMAENKFGEKAPHDFVIGSAVPFIDPRKFVPDRPKTLSFESSHEEQRIREEILAPAPVASVATHSPMETSSEKMLPGMDAETLPFEFEEEHTFFEEMNDGSSQKEPISVGEPTIEEYKRRLNELLSGGK